MDDSMSSTNYMRSKVPLSSRSTGDDTCSQGSGWTLYFVDLVANDHHNEDKISNSFDSGFQTSSMVASFSLHRCRNKLISKRKIKAKQIFVDEDLEDTASSPVHSLKVNDLSCLYMKSKEMESRDVCQENISRNSQMPREGTGMGFLETELRRKGLCLVPMSMLLNIC